MIHTQQLRHTDNAILHWLSVKQSIKYKLAVIIFKAKQSGLLVSIITQSTSVLRAYTDSAFLHHSINCNAFYSLLCLLISQFQLQHQFSGSRCDHQQDLLKLFVLLKLDSISLQFTSTYTTIPRTIQRCHSTSEPGVSSGAVRIGPTPWDVKPYTFIHSTLIHMQLWRYTNFLYTGLH